MAALQKGMKKTRSHAASSWMVVLSLLHAPVLPPPVFGFASACFFVHAFALARARAFVLVTKRVNQGAHNQEGRAAQAPHQRPARDAVERVGIRAIHCTCGDDFNEGRKACDHERRKCIGREFFGNCAYAERAQRHHEGEGVQLAQRARVDECRANYAHADE